MSEDLINTMIDLFSIVFPNCYQLCYIYFNRINPKLESTFAHDQYSFISHHKIPKSTPFNHPKIYTFHQHEETSGELF